MKKILCDLRRSRLGIYDGPRMTEELNEPGIPVGQRHVGQLMRRNGIKVRLAPSSPHSGISIRISRRS
jgi:hypothetical protein